MAKGALKAFVDVKIGDIVIKDFRVVQQEGSEAWVSVPQKEYNYNGEKRYAKMITLSNELKMQVDKVILDTINQ